MKTRRDCIAVSFTLDSITMGSGRIVRKYLGLRARLHFVSICLSVVFGFGWAEEPESVRIGTYNVRNYLTMDRLVEGRWRPEYPKPESEKKVVRETILAVRPDLIALQEIGERAHLLELQRDLASEGLEYSGSAWLEAHDSERHLATLWTENLDVVVVEHPNLPIRYMGEVDFVKRGMLELRIEDVKGEWSLFNLHLKSKYTNVKSDPLSSKRRTLEGRAARDRILAVYPRPDEARYLIVGDLNDSPVSGAVRAFLRKGERDLSLPVESSDDLGFRWTHYYRKEDSYSRIDYILRSPGWGDVFNGIKGRIDRRPNYYDGSDHRLVWVDLPVGQATD